MRPVPLPSSQAVAVHDEGAAVRAAGHADGAGELDRGALAILVPLGAARECGDVHGDSGPPDQFANLTEA